MSDLLTDYACRSVAYFLESQSGPDDAYIITPDFDWDNKPDPNNPGTLTLRRDLPYAGVLLINDVDNPFTVSANILYEKEIELHIIVCASSYTELVRTTSDLCQAMRSSVNPVTSGVGITLYDYTVASGSYYATAGTMQISLNQSQYFGAADQKEEGNRKFRSITPVTLTAFRDATATLLENKGRISLTDS